MLSLTPHEARVLGVLIEKAQTTPAQYPLTLNACVGGANQKNNREPVMNLTEDDALDALDGLRNKQLVREVMLTGSRVSKYRHVARETLEVSTSELVVLAELMLRGAQTVGEIRGRATRMHPLESVEAVQSILDGLASRGESLVKQIPPAPGSRAPRFMQLLSPQRAPTLDAPSGDHAASARPEPAQDGLERRIAQLEESVARLQQRLDEIERRPA